MEVNEKAIWMGFATVILIFLVITTPGWKEVLGFNISLDFGEYLPALILLGFMGALVGFVILSDKGNNGEV